MEAKRKSLWIALAAILGIVIAAIAAVRLVLTPEKLTAIMLPRVEKMVGARVTIGDIHINFPFGFGVDIEDLRFVKTLPDTTALDFFSETVTVRASLLSLLRRKPEIKSAAARGGVVALVNAGKQREIRLRGLQAQLSSERAGELIAARAKVRADTVLVGRPLRPPSIALEDLSVDGEFETDAEFSRLMIREARVSWEDLVSLKITGEVADIKTTPRLDLAIEAQEKPLGPMLAKIKAFRLDELAPDAGRAPKNPAKGPSVELSGGALSFSARVEGLAREPLGLKVAFEANLDGAALRAGELATINSIEARFTGAGDAAAWQHLLPSATGSVTLEQISRSWAAIELEGTIDLKDGEFLIRSGTPAADSAAGGVATAPLRISAFKATAQIAGADVKRLSGEFRLAESPYTFSGSLSNILPAAAELAFIARKLEQAGGGRPIGDLGPYLDGMVNAPTVLIDVSGRSFDWRPYQKRPGRAGAQAERSSAGAQTAPGGAGAILLLKNTSFTAKLDSVVTREALLTAVEAKGTIRGGRVRIDPATFTYAGGKGSATVASDVRNPERVASSIDFMLDGVEAGEALGRLLSIGTLVQGRFSVTSKASVITGRGIDPLVSLTAAGTALSNKGSVNFGKYLGSLSTIQNFDVAPLTSFDFSEWKGIFQVRDGRFVTEDWKIASTAGAWAIKGSFGLDGMIDYAVHLVVPPAVQQRMKNIDAYKSALDLMRDSSGNLVLDIRVTGSSKHPSAMLDLTRAKGKAQERVLEGLKKLIR